jgi:WD40 repeat protein
MAASVTPLKLSTAGMSQAEIEDLERKQKKRAAQIQKKLQSQLKAAQTKRAHRWAIEYQASNTLNAKLEKKPSQGIEEERRLMQVEDTLSYARECKYRTYEFSKFLDYWDKVQLKSDKAKERALEHSNKGAGKLLNKGWYEGMEIEMSSPNVIREYVGHDLGVRHFCVSKDEKLMFTASDDHKIVVWDLVKCTQLATFKGHKGFVSRLKMITAVPENSTVPQPKVVVSTSQDMSIRKWDAQLRGYIEGNKTITTVDNAHHEPIHSIDLSLDGNYIISCSSDKTIKLWETKRMRMLHTYFGHVDVVTAVCFSPDGKEFVSTGGATDPSIKQWDAKVYERLPKKEWPPEFVRLNQGFFKKFQVHNGMYTVYEETEKNDEVVNTRENESADVKDSEENGKNDDEEKKEEIQLSLDEISESFIPDVEGIGEARGLWDSRRMEVVVDEVALRGGLIRTFDMRKFGVKWYGHTGWVNAVQYSRSGRRIATASVDHTIKIWKPKDGTLMATLTGHTDWVMSVSWSPDDRRIISGGADHSVRIWNVKNRVMIKVLHGHADVVYHAEELLSGRVMSSSLDSYVKMWQVKPTPPDAPRKPKITKVDQYFLDVLWEAPPAMGEKIIEYVIQRREGAPNADNDAEWGHEERLKVCDELSLHIDELTPGISYQIRVCARNKVGMGKWSEYSRWARTYAACPLRIAAPDVETVTKTTIAISWKQPRDMGAHINQILVQLRGGGIRNFGEGETYKIDMAVARQGALDVAHAINSRAKEELKKMRIKEGMKQIEVRRLRVRKKILKIEVKKKRLALKKANDDLGAGHGALLATVMKNLKPGVLYQFRVAAVNRVGVSPWSRPSFSTATAATTPDTVEEFRITEMGVRSLSYEWKPPYDSGSIINGYYLRYREYVAQTNMLLEMKGTQETDENAIRAAVPTSNNSMSEEVVDEAKEWQVFNISTVQPLQRSVEFLEPGTRYECQFAASNNEGVGPWCNSIIARTGISPPDAPDAAFPIPAGPTKMRVHFRRPYHNGGVVRGYKVRWRQNGGSVFSEENEVLLDDEECKDICPQNIKNLEFERNQRLGRARAATTTGDGAGEDLEGGFNGWRSFLLSGLQASTVYEFTIASQNQVGFSDFSIPSDEVPTDRAKVPNVMEEPMPLEETMNSIDLTWEVPFHNGSKITCFAYCTMDVAVGEFDTPQVFEDLDPGVNRGTVSGLRPGKTYVFRIAAINGVGQGKWSDPTTPIKCPTKMEYTIIAHKRKIARDAKDKEERMKEKERKLAAKATNETSV